MRIESSAISMTSDRKYVRYSEASSETTVTQIVKAATSSNESSQARQDISEFNTKQKEETSNVKQKDIEVKTLDEIKLEIVKKMLRAMKKIKSEGIRTVNCESKRQSEDSSSLSQLKSKLTCPKNASPEINLSINIGSPAQTKWRQTTIESSFFAELENTAYEATGIVNAADGRNISFGVSIEMTRAFCEKYKSVSTQEYISTDPLVINLESNYANISNQKFLFDIDANGQEESVSLTERGSGFIALDKNNDGVINNGGELFGTKSGDGFADLAAYDSDGNSWIDEADAVFDDLKIWTKDDNGNDVIMSFKEAGVGAIYLNKASTEFSLNDNETNQTNAIIRSTGVYLKESGEVGTLQHVDLTL